MHDDLIRLLEAQVHITDALLFNVAFSTEHYRRHCIIAGRMMRACAAIHDGIKTGTLPSHWTVICTVDASATKKPRVLLVDPTG